MDVSSLRRSSTSMSEAGEDGASVAPPLAPGGGPVVHYAWARPGAKVWPSYPTSLSDDDDDANLPEPQPLPPRERKKRAKEWDKAFKKALYKAGVRYVHSDLEPVAQDSRFPDDHCNLAYRMIHEDLAARALAGAVANNRCLVSINLEGNKLYPAGAQALCEALRGNTRLRRLNLARTHIGPEGVAAVAALLAEEDPDSGLPALQSLGLADNNVNGDAARLLAAALCRGGRGLQGLDLSRNMSLHDSGLVDFAEGAAPGDAPPLLRRLRLDWCARGEDALQAAAMILASFPELRELSLRHVTVWAPGPDGNDSEYAAQAVSRLGRAVAQARNLRILCLADTDLGPAGAAALEQGVREGGGLTALVSLDVGGNPLGGAGVLRVADLVRASGTLEHVCLRGVRAPAEALWELMRAGGVRDAGGDAWTWVPRPVRGVMHRFMYDDQQDSD
ncbi:unnamed protein product [Pedinophyceae sp. YPF-701]|nr:unnamed protein product [Pedinophyceae sp. YPF-701]